jgi:hypothetical protein
MEKSAKDKQKYNEGVDKVDWKEAKNSREAFKDEARRIRGDKGGVGSKDNVNKRNSPGEKYIKQDGEG